MYDNAAQTLTDYNLAGQVKQVQEISIGIHDEIPNLETYHWKGKRNQSDILKFDKKGRLTSRLVQADTNGLEGHHYFYYDKNGLLFQSKEANRKINYIYNDENQLVEIKKEYNGYSTKFIHGKQDDGTGNTFVTIEWYSGDYSPNNREVYEFDKQGRTITYKKDNYRNHITYHGNTVVDSSLTYGNISRYFKKATFNKGRLVQLSNHKYVEGSTSKTVVLAETNYKYNKKGDLITEEHSDVDSPENNYRHIYEYQYDSEDNWVVQKVYKNDRPTATNIRKITYFKRQFIGIL